MRHGITISLAGLAVAAMAGVASAQVDPIGPFTGDNSEIFEGKDSAFLACVATGGIEGIFDFRANLCANSAHVTGGWGFACTIRPWAGSRLYGSTGSPSTITFDVPAEKFGGYFGSNATNTTGGSAEFFDENGVLLANVQLDMRADCEWYWNGWEFSTPVKEIVMQTDRPGGGYLMMDELQVVWDTGTVPCYPDCDNNETLDFFDFLCFQNAFLAQDPYADCDGNTVLDFFDFLCFQNEFLAGC